MIIFGYRIELLLLLQLLVTTIIITVYAVLTSLQEAKSDRISKSHIALLVHFLIEHHQKLKSFLEVSEATQEDIDNSDSDIHWLWKYHESLQTTGSFPIFGSMEWTSLLPNLLFMLSAPLTTPLFSLFVFSEEKKYRLQRLTHTERRKDLFSKYIVLLSSNLFVLFVNVVLILPKSAILGYVILVVVSISIVISLIVVAAVVRWQMSWKEFWQDKLLDVMALASKEKDHDVFNRAMILRNYMETQPDVPLPGNLGFYTVIYSGVQVVLLLVYNFIQRSSGAFMSSGAGPS